MLGETGLLVNHSLNDSEKIGFGGVTGVGHWDYKPRELLHYNLKVSTLVFNICCKLRELRLRAGVKQAGS